MNAREAVTFILVFTSFTAGVVGCAGPSPRFASPEGKPDKEQPSDRPRFSSRESQEEQAEDDIKIDLDRVRKRFASRDASLIGKDESVLSNVDRNTMMDEILAHIGTPYAGGNETGSLDCSEFAALVYKNSLNRLLPRTTKEQFKRGRKIDRASLRFGDLVFFNTTGENPSHVGIYIGDDLFAHASVTWGVTISSMNSTYFRKRFTGARRVL